MEKHIEIMNNKKRKLFQGRKQICWSEEDNIIEKEFKKCIIHKKSVKLYTHIVHTIRAAKQNVDEIIDKLWRKRHHEQVKFELTTTMWKKTDFWNW